MNQEQVKSGVRWAVATFGGAIAGFVAGKGWASAETIMSVLSSEAFLAIASAVAVFVWSMFTHTEANAVAVVNTIAKDPASPVEGIITTNTKAGRELAYSLPGDTIVVAGTADAIAIAKPAGVKL